MGAMTPDEIMDRAADAIIEHGWCARYLRMPSTGAMCVLGAMRFVALPPDNLDEHLVIVGGDTVTDVEHWSALLETNKFIAAPGVDGSKIGAVSQWNDTRCRNKYDAAELLRSEAKRYREEHS